MKTKKLFSALIGASVMLSGLSGMDDMDNIVVQDCPGYNSWSFVHTDSGLEKRIFQGREISRTAISDVSGNRL